MPLVPVSNRGEAIVLCGDPYMAVKVPRGVRLDPETLRLEDGSDLVPGDRIHAMDGTKTAAGFPKFHMVDGYVEFRGSYHFLGDHLVLFHAKDSGDVLHPIHEHDEMTEGGRWDVYIGWHWYCGALIYSTPALAGRVIHTASVVRWDGRNRPADWSGRASA